jgi:hypothetical protein
VLTESDSTLIVWDAPSWANARVVDEASIEHYRNIGEISPIEGYEPLKVEVIQRDDLYLKLEPASVMRSPEQIRVGEVRMSVAQIRELMKLLVAALEMVGVVPAQMVAAVGAAVADLELGGNPERD